MVAVGRVRGALQAAVSEYEERARRYWKLEVIEVEAGTSGRDAAGERAKEAEAGRILARVPEGFTVVALTRGGSGITSRAWTDMLEAEAVRSSPGVAFLLGGAHGLSEAVLLRAHRRVSLSPLTMPHEMARLVLAEQLYRAGTLLRGEPYHKGA